MSFNSISFDQLSATPNQQLTQFPYTCSKCLQINKLGSINDKLESECFSCLTSTLSDFSQVDRILKSVSFNKRQSEVTDNIQVNCGLGDCSWKGLASSLDNHENQHLLKTEINQVDQKLKLLARMLTLPTLISADFSDSDELKARLGRKNALLWQLKQQKHNVYLEDGLAEIDKIHYLLIKIKDNPIAEEKTSLLNIKRAPLKETLTLNSHKHKSSHNVAFYQDIIQFNPSKGKESGFFMFNSVYKQNLIISARIIGGCSDFKLGLHEEPTGESIGYKGYCLLAGDGSVVIDNTQVKRFDVPPVAVGMQIKMLLNWADRELTFILGDFKMKIKNLSEKGAFFPGFQFANHVATVRIEELNLY